MLIYIKQIQYAIVKKLILCMHLYTVHYCAHFMFVCTHLSMGYVQNYGYSYYNGNLKYLFSVNFDYTYMIFLLGTDLRKDLN